MVPLLMPGGPELLVMVLVLLVPAAIVAGVVALHRRRRDRVEALEAKVDELEAELRGRE